MKVEDIVALLNAGYSKEEITAMDAETEKQAIEEPKEEPKEKATEQNENETVNKLIEQNNELIKQLKEAQAANARNARQDDEKRVSADDVIKNFIHSM